MALGLTQPVIGAAQSGLEKTKAEFDEFAQDPIYISGVKTRKWGFVTLAGGIASFILWQVGKQLDQSYLNDIDQTLGLPQENKPTASPPTPPPPQPWIVQVFNNAVGDINQLSTSNAVQAVAQLQAVITDLFGIRDQVYQPNAGLPTQLGPVVNGVTTGGNLVNALLQTAGAIFALRGLTGNIPVTNTQIGALTEQQSIYYLYEEYVLLYENDPTANPFPSGVAPGYVEDFWAAINSAMAPFPPPNGVNYESDWPTAFSMVGTTTEGPNTKSSMNDMCIPLGITQPFDLNQPPVNNPWGPFGGFVEFFIAAESAPAVGLSNFFQDVQTFGSNVGAAFAFIAKVLANLPRLSFDAMGYAFWWGVDQVASIIWMPLIVIGGALLGWSVFALNVYPKIKGRVVLTIKAKMAPVWAELDRALAVPKSIPIVRKEQAVDVAIQEAIQTPTVKSAEIEAPPLVPSPPVIEPEPPGEAKGTKPEESGGAVIPAAGDETLLERKGEAQPKPEIPPAEGVPPPPIPVASTEETEELLGQAPNLREQRMSLETQGTPFVGQKSDTPEAPGTTFAAPAVSEPVPAPIPEPTYRERLQERRRRRSKEVLEGLDGAFAPVAA